MCNNLTCCLCVLIICHNLCYTECVHLLLAHGAKVRSKNSQGWSPLAEAISRGNRQMGERSLLLMLLLVSAYNLTYTADQRI